MKVPTVVNSVALGLLLKRGLMSSIERTLFPIDSVKSVNILLLKKTSFDKIPLDSLVKFKLFSVAISKSNTQLVSITPERSLTIEISVNPVVRPTVNGWDSFEVSTWRSPNFLYPIVWFNDDTISFQSSKATVLLNAYEKFW